MPDNANATASALLSEIAEEERLLDALYREAARRFGLPDCAMWVLYFLAISEEPVTQQGLCGLMMYPKQTINSSVAKLVDRGLVELAGFPGARNSKSVALTAEGRKLADATVLRMRAAEERALASLGGEGMRSFVGLYRRFREAVQSEMANEA